MNEPCSTPRAVRFGLRRSRAGRKTRHRLPPGPRTGSHCAWRDGLTGAATIRRRRFGQTAKSPRSPMRSSPCSITAPQPPRWADSGTKWHFRGSSGLATSNSYVASTIEFQPSIDSHSDPCAPTALPLLPHLPVVIDRHSSLALSNERGTTPSARGVPYRSIAIISQRHPAPAMCRWSERPDGTVA